jgi:hypothetical protein
MFEHPAQQIDFRPYAGQHVIIGCAAPEQPRPRHTAYYVLGTVADHDLPDHVKAIIADDAVECSELLFVVIVNDTGRVVQWMPLVVFDDHGKLRYGYEVLQAIIETKKSSPVYKVEGIHLG